MSEPICYICKKHCPLDRIVVCAHKKVPIPLTVCCECYDDGLPDPINPDLIPAQQKPKPCRNCKQLAHWMIENVGSRF